MKKAGPDSFLPEINEERRRDGGVAEELSTETQRLRLRDRLLQEEYEKMLAKEVGRRWFELHGKKKVAINSPEYARLGHEIESNPLLIALAELAHDNTLLTEQAGQNTLTGLATGPTAEKVFNTLRERKVPGAGATIVVRMDLDGFKKINYVLGYEHGNETLLAVAEKLQTAIEHLRGSDLAIHFSGDEFGLILTNVKPGIDEEKKAMTLEQTAEKIIARIIGYIEEIAVPAEINNSKHLTASAGFIIVEHQDEARKDFSYYCQLASKAQYMAKDLKFIPRIEAGSQRVIDYNNPDKKIIEHQIDRLALHQSLISAKNERLMLDMIAGYKLTAEEKRKIQDNFNDTAAILAAAATRSATKL